MCARTVRFHGRKTLLCCIQVTGQPNQKRTEVFRLRSILQLLRCRDQHCYALRLLCAWALALAIAVAAVCLVMVWFLLSILSMPHLLRLSTDFILPFLKPCPPSPEIPS